MGYSYKKKIHPRAGGWTDYKFDFDYSQFPALLFGVMRSPIFSPA